MRLFGNRQPRDSQKGDEAERLRRAAEAERSGLRCLKDGDLLQAEVELRHCVELNPGYPLGHGYLGLTLYRQGRLAEAAEALGLAIQLAPGDEVLQRTNGMILEAENRWEEAAAAYRKAIDLNPLSARAHAALGSLALKRNALAEAEQHVETALRIDPHDPQALAELAEIRHRAGNIGGAIEAIGGALAIRPGSAPNHYKLGVLLEEAGQIEPAIVALKTAHQSLPSDAEVLEALGRSLIRSGRHSEMAEIYEKAIRNYPQHQDRYSTDMLRLVVERPALQPAVHYPAGQTTDQAAQRVAGATTRLKDLPQGVRTTGADKGTQVPGRPPVDDAILTSIAHLKAAVEADPQNSRLHRDLSIQYLRAGRLPEAREHALAAEQLHTRHQSRS